MTTATPWPWQAWRPPGCCGGAPEPGAGLQQPGVGSRTRQAQTSQAAQQSLFSSAQAARDNYSGVNLDEEAANLLRFQQAYQAAAQVISVANQVFQTLLNVASR